MKPLDRWVVVWLCLGTTIVLWDVGFVLMRPTSMPGGSLAWFWPVYGTYVEIDHSYGDLASGFVRAQAVMSLLEAGIVGAALFAHRTGRHQAATLLAFTASSLTAAKTLLILLIEALGGGHSVGHNDLPTLVSGWLMPNLVWVIVPLLVVRATGRELLRRR